MSQSRPEGPYSELAESGVATMALAEIEQARVRRAMDAFMQQRRPPDEKHESPIGKATFVRARAVWRVFWQRRDLKWHSYEPRPEVKSVEEFTSLVSKDAHACFFG